MISANLLLDVPRVPVLSPGKGKVAGESTTLAYYPVRSGLPQLKAYFQGQPLLYQRAVCLVCWSL